MPWPDPAYSLQAVRRQFYAVTISACNSINAARMLVLEFLTMVAKFGAFAPAERFQAPYNFKRAPQLRELIPAWKN